MLLPSVALERLTNERFTLAMALVAAIAPQWAQNSSSA